MRTHQLCLQRIAKLGLVLALITSMSACSTSWKEEVRLHDGSTLIAKRSQSRGGTSEPGNRSPINQQKITFTVPKTDKTYSFTSDYSEDIDAMDFNLLALHILDGTPYLIVTPNRCLSYNKWGRPNPPYVVFKHEASDWKRIPLQELPSEFKEINLMVGGYDPYQLTVKERDASVLSAEVVKKLNGKLTQPEYKGLLREPLSAERTKELNQWCGEMVSYGKSGGWIGLDWFTDQPSLNACLKFCDHKKVSAETCPCNSIFKGK
jgi:hypothetical protein